jgi:thiol:disulfide interchange protein DsbG
MNSSRVLSFWKPRAALLAVIALWTAVPNVGRAQAGATSSPMRALQQARWIAEGSAHPKHVLYVFMDANCPYCHRLWLALQPHYHDGLQVRNVLVGIIAPSSSGKAASALEARDPAAQLRVNEQRWGSRSDGGGGIAPLADPSTKVLDALTHNETLMQAFGISGTPGLVYIDVAGKVHVLAGLPATAELTAIVRSAVVPHP